MAFWFVVKKVVGEADAVVFVVDARMPEMSRNMEVQELLDRSGKEVVLVLNKIDLVPVEKQDDIKRQYPHAFFAAATQNVGISDLRRELHIIGKRLKKKTLKVGIVGYPNVGKSALINALARRKRALMSPIAGTTKGIQFIRAGSLKILDSPGVIDMDDPELKLGVIGAKNPEDLRNPELVAAEIIEYVCERDRKALERYVGGVLEGEDSDELLFNIGMKKGYLVKGGKVDERRTALQIIRDWQKGKLKI
ncbi:50S ribosome-binding GTPase [Candidatus Pacearchaeota archaeon]|nr:50S ribosome-binding GTPase [Candidatus Pacearchaeota archaeon]